MNSVITLTGLETRRLTSSKMRANEETRSLWLARANAGLMLENTRLQSDYDALVASSVTWIRLYEAALERANTAAAECSRLRDQRPRSVSPKP
jgi:hypothetical protein